MNPYEAPTKDSEYSHNCRYMSTIDFTIYSFMVLTLGFCVGITIGIVII